MKFVAYYRVSTNRQGQSGLGLDAQQESVQRLIEFKKGEIVRSFREVESGGKNSRPELAAALLYARQHSAALVVAKLDRLSRDAKFLLTLADGNVPILFGDFPDLDATTPVGRMVLTQMAAVAEFERRRISERVKAALEQAKKRGVKLGGVKTTEVDPEISRIGREAHTEKANKRALELYEIIKQIDETGEMSCYRLAKELNLRNIDSPRGTGGHWGTTAVRRLLKRIEDIHERERANATKSIRSVSSRLQNQSRPVRKRSLGGEAGPVAD